jgi:hypothetical protein
LPEYPNQKGHHDHPATDAQQACKESGADTEDGHFDQHGGVKNHGALNEWVMVSADAAQGLRKAAM